MTVRDKGLADQHTLVWNAENRLSEALDSAGDMLERYWYDIDGARVKKVSGNTTTNTFLRPLRGGGQRRHRTTEIRHYSFGSLRIAVKGGSTTLPPARRPPGQHVADHAGVIHTQASRAYYAYGAERSASGDLQTDRTFTGQKSDASGLLYYNARYYDPALGTFISPVSLVPNQRRVIDYNRFAYARNNPLRYNDPSGHCPWCISIGIGAVVGAAMSYGTQVVANVSRDGLNADAFTDVNWARVGAGAVSGAIGGATLGLSPAVLGTGAIAAAGTRVVGGVLEGQVEIVAENVLSGQDLLAGVGDP